MTKQLWFWYFLGVLTAADTPIWLAVDRHVAAAVPERFPDKRVTWQRFSERPDLRLASLSVPMASPSPELRLTEHTYSLYKETGRGWRPILRYLPTWEAEERPFHAQSPRLVVAGRFRDAHWSLRF